MFCFCIDDPDKSGEYLLLKDRIQKGKIVPKNISSVEILDVNGNKILFGSIYQNKTILVSFLRHFGCVLCIEQANEIISRRKEFHENSVEVVFIGSGTPKQAKKFQDKYEELKEAKIYLDTNLTLYKAFKTQSYFCPSVSGYLSLSRAWSKGYKQSEIQGDAYRLGGCWLIDNGLVLFEHLEKFPGDLVKLDEIMTNIPLKFEKG